MNAEPGRLLEVYRLRVAVQTDRGRVMQAIPGEERIFATWRAANKEAKAISDRGRLVVSQSVLLDSEGRVVFPPEDSQQTSRGKWVAIAVVMDARRADVAAHEAPAGGAGEPGAAAPPPPTRRRPPRRRRLGLDPRVEARIRELRLREGKAAKA